MPLDEPEDAVTQPGRLASTSPTPRLTLGITAVPSRVTLLRDALDRLRDEHQTVTRVQGELLALLAEITTADPRRFRTELDRMSQELSAHLDYEEESLLPVLAEIPWPPAPPS